MRVHRELFAGPVHRTAQPAQLPRDRAARLLLPFPDIRDELFAAHVGPLHPLTRKIAFHHHLRGDARMVGAHDPQRIFPAQPFVAHDDVLQRIVQRMADMQRSGDVGRRVDDSEGFGVGAVRAEQPVRLPMRIPALLDFGGIECGGKGAGHETGLPMAGIENGAPVPAAAAGRNLCQSVGKSRAAAGQRPDTIQWPPGRALCTLVVGSVCRHRRW